MTATDPDQVIIDKYVRFFAGLFRSHLDELRECTNLNDTLRVLGTLDGLSSALTFQILNYEDLSPQLREQYRNGWDHGVKAAGIIAEATNADGP